MKRILIFSGGTLGDWALSHIQPDDVLIGADRGAYFLTEHDYAPDIALGDFDSVSEEELARIKSRSKQFYSCDPVMKDQTDTEMALDTAIRMKPAEIVMLGVLGTRWDHALANVHLLYKALQNGISCKIADACNELRLIDSHARIERGAYTHVSLLPLSMEVLGITLSGFQYPLHDAELRIGNSLGISNVLLEPCGEVRIKQGLLLVIQSKDPEE